jgi:hypothetical protein
MMRPPLDILREVAERLGFLNVLHGCPPLGAEGYQDVVAVDYHGSAKGTIVVGCGPGVGAALAANMLPMAPPDADTAREATLELANVVAGNLVAVLHPEDELRLDPPRTAAWPAGARLTAALETDEGVLALAVCGEAPASPSASPAPAAR